MKFSNNKFLLCWMEKRGDSEVHVSLAILTINNAALKNHYFEQIYKNYAYTCLSNYSLGLVINS